MAEKNLRSPVWQYFTVEDKADGKKAKFNLYHTDVSGLLLVSRIPVLLMQEITNVYLQDVPSVFAPMRCPG